MYDTCIDNSSFILSPYRVTLHHSRRTEQREVRQPLERFDNDGFHTPSDGTDD